MKKKQHYIHSNDINFISSLKKEDRIKGYRMVNGEEKELTYIIDYDPVFFPHGGNWTLRCHSRSVNHLVGLSEHTNLTEYVYINPTNLARFKFPMNLVMAFERKKSISNFIKYHGELQSKRSKRN